MMCVQWRLRWVLQRHHEPHQPAPFPHQVIRKALFLPTTVHLHVPDPARQDTAYIRTGNTSPRVSVSNVWPHSESVVNKPKWTRLLSDSLKLGPWIVVTARMNLEQKLWVRDTVEGSAPTAVDVLGTYKHYITTADCPQSSNAVFLNLCETAAR